MTISTWLLDAVAGVPLNLGKSTRQAMASAVFGATAGRPLGARSGVRYGTSITTVTATSTTWTVGSHAGVLDVKISNDAGCYWYAVNSTGGLPTGAMRTAHATYARTDIICAHLDDPAEVDGSSVPAVTFTYTYGPETGTVLPPATPASSMVVATILVPVSGGGAPTVSWVAPTAVAAGGIIPVRNTTERDALHLAYPGTADAPLIVWRKDAASFEYNDGTGWKAFGGAARPANAAALAAITGMVIDNRAYQVDTGITYRYNGSAWKAWESDWITYTATLAGFAVGTLGSPVAETIWQYRGGLVQLNWRFVFGTNGDVTFSGGATFTLPVSAHASETFRAHTATINRTTATHAALTRIESGLTTARITLGTSPVGNVTSTTPWGGGWAAGDFMTGSLTFRPA